MMLYHLFASHLSYCITSWGGVSANIKSNQTEPLNIVYSQYLRNHFSLRAHRPLIVNVLSSLID